MRSLVLVYLLASLSIEVRACIQTGAHFPKPNFLRFAPDKERKVIATPTSASIAAPKLELSLPFTAEEGLARVSGAAADPFSRSVIEGFESRKVDTDSSDEIIRYSAALIFSGRVADAISVLIKLERDHPGLYATASNLGTAYELSGDPMQALYWIREGVSRNPSSHDGTEWLHVAILETKLHLQRNESWLADHSVLDAAEPRSPDDTLKAIKYQLNERLRFIGAPDPVVSDLFLRGGLLMKETHPEESALYLAQAASFSDRSPIEPAPAGSAR